MVGAVLTSAVTVTTSLLQGQQRLRDSTVQRQSKAGAKRSALVGIVPTSTMMNVLRGKRTASTKGHGRRVSKKNKTSK